MRSLKSCLAGPVFLALLFVSFVSSDTAFRTATSDKSSFILAVKLIAGSTGLPNILQETWETQSCQNDSDCSSWIGTHCVFDTKEDKQICKCKDDGKRYSDAVDRCLIPCKNDTECLHDGQCIRWDVPNFCFCRREFRGDFCEVDRCIEPCGNTSSSSEVQCKYDGDLKAPYCSCTNSGLGFDYDNKTCTECECDGTGYRCEYRNGNKTCVCGITSYEKDGNCEDCNCGEPGTFWSCQLTTDGEKECSCKSKYKMNNGSCESCFCGDIWSTCEFQNGSKVCNCKEGWLQDRNYTCRPCDCGEGGKCSFDEGNNRVCDCRSDYIEHDGKCVYCKCTGAISSPNCTVNAEGEATCPCVEGYSQQSLECKSCDCGTNGTCSFYGSRKQCKCDVGFIEDDGTCAECDCVGYGKCEIINGRKDCTCYGTFQEFKGTCIDCSCGKDESTYHCKLNSTGGKVCTCKDGYALFLGECFSCSSCGPQIGCSYDNSGNKKCNCSEDAVEYKGACEDCNCGNYSKGCDYARDSKYCQCEDGFNEKNATCTDVDECLTPERCHSNAKCVNSPGSYDCFCLEGYETKGDIKKVGCQDIDECSDVDGACHSSAALCFNLPGSYRCDCIEGYEGVKENGHSKSPQYTKCVVDKRSLKTTTVVFGVLLGLVGSLAVSTVIYIVYKRRQDSAYDVIDKNLQLEHRGR